MSLEVRDIMVKNVVTVDLDYTVKHAADIMSRFGLGCVIVLKNDEVVGILTERDLLKRIVAVARDPDETFVEEVMTKPVIVVGPDVGMDDALRLMFKHKIKKLPVVERCNGGGRLVGLVTLTDIARVQPKVIKTLKELFEREQEEPPRSIKKVMDYYII